MDHEVRHRIVLTDDELKAAITRYLREVHDIAAGNLAFADNKVPEEVVVVWSEKCD